MIAREVFGLSRVDEFAEADVANVGIWAGAATDEDIVFAKLGDEVVLGFGHRFGHRIALVQALKLLLQPLHRFAFVRPITTKE